MHRQQVSRLLQDLNLTVASGYSQRLWDFSMLCAAHGSLPWETLDVDSLCAMLTDCVLWTDPCNSYLAYEKKPNKTTCNKYSLICHSVNFGWMSRGTVNIFAQIQKGAKNAGLALCCDWCYQMNCSSRWQLQLDRLEMLLLFWRVKRSQANRKCPNCENS